MIIKNPTDKAIEVQLEGTVYRVEAEGILEGVPEKCAIMWRDQIHNFISIEEEGVIEVPEVVTKEEVVAEVKEEVTEEVTEEVEKEVKKSPKKTVKSSVKNAKS